MKVVVSFLALAFCLSKHHFVESGRNCKCLYGQPCWPASDAFDALSSTLSQPLIHPLPPAAPCYSAAAGDAAFCLDARTNSFNGTWRSNQPGAYENTNYEAHMFPNGTLSACEIYALDSTTAPSKDRVSCGRGSVPPIGVDARSPQDVQAAVKFASEHNLKIVVKNTGHDFMGRSAGRDGFMIWTHRLKSIDFHDDFSVHGAPESDLKHHAVTLGAGVQWAEAYAAGAAAGRHIVGGTSNDGSTGAAGGWLLGGGHSLFSAKFGLGVDNLLEITLVNAQGEHITANPYTNPTLFWAVRGGGGGTFGITTSVTYRTHPLFPVTGAIGFLNFTSPDNAQRGISAFLRHHVDLADAFWGGYSMFTNTSLLFSFFAPNVSLADAQVTISPLFDALRKEGAEGAHLELYPFDSYYTIWETLPRLVPGLASFLETIAGLPGSPRPGSQTGMNMETSSRLLSRDMALNDPEGTAQTLLSLNHLMLINFVAGGAVSTPDPDSMALHPAWRSAVAQVWMADGWKDGASVEEIQNVQRNLKDKTIILDKITTDSAAYLNEATMHEVDFKKSFWGPHYPKLKEIKMDVDPNGLFVVPYGVGSEDWDFEVACRSKL